MGGCTIHRPLLCSLSQADKKDPFVLVCDKKARDKRVGNAAPGRPPQIDTEDPDEAVATYTDPPGYCIGFGLA